jgi:hypothetical protein
MYEYSIRYVPATKNSQAKAIQYLTEMRDKLEDNLPSVIASLQELSQYYSQPQSLSGMYVCDRNETSRPYHDRHTITQRIVSFSRIFIDWETISYDDNSSPILFGERALLPEEEEALNTIAEKDEADRRNRKLAEFERLKRELNK